MLPNLAPVAPSAQIAFAVLKGNGNRTCGGGEGRVETDILKDKTNEG